MTGFSRLMLCTAITGTMFAMPHLAQAQDSEAESRTTRTLDMVVVTARKSEENLQTTPVAVTALSADAILDAQVADVSDLQRTAPGLVIAQGGASTSGFAFVSIRGQGNLQPILANDPAVGTYIDGVYVARPSVGLTDLQDIQRIEVLRGPQGTLFGRNTTGGAINIISNDPVLGEFSGQVKGELGSDNYKAASATINVPLTERLAWRTNYSFRKRDGFGNSQVTGRDVLDVNTNFIRSKLKYEGDSWSLVLSGDYNKMEDEGSGIQLAAVNTALVPAPFQPGLLASLHTKDNWWDTYALGTTQATGTEDLPADIQAMYGVAPYNNLEVYGTSAKLDIELGDWAFQSTTSWRHSENEGLTDTDSSPVPLLATFAGSNSEYFSQEFQVSGNLTDRLSVISGGYYGREAGYEYSRSQIFGGLLRDSNADVVNKTFGVYAQGYYSITDDLRLMGGYRHTWDERDSFLHNAQVLGLPYDAPVARTPYGINCTVDADTPPTATDCTKTQLATFDYPAWALGLDWQATPSLFVYAKTSSASKAGGWNLRAGGLPAFAPEKVKDVEFGFKADTLQQRLRFNAALFHTWKSQNQAIVNDFVPGIGVTQYIQNNGDVRIWGLETELVFLPWEGMEVTGNLSVMDGEYKSGSFQEIQVIAGSGCTNSDNVVDGCVVDLSDTPLIQFPKSQFNLSAKQVFELAGGELSVLGSWSYVDEQHYSAVKPADEQPDAVKMQYAEENALGLVDSYNLFNARVAFRPQDRNFEVAAFIRNIGNEKYLTRRFPDVYRQLGIATEFAGEARHWGVSLSYDF